jgi:2-dehydropantoate 2-reductase
MAEEALACFAAANLSLVSASEWAAPPTSSISDLPIEGRSRPGSSTWQSVARGASVETDFLNGEVVQLGRLHGVPTPVNQAVQDQMRRVVTGSVAPGSVAPSALLRSADG